MNKSEEVKPKVTFGKFQNIDLRVAEVTAAPLADGTTHPCRVMSLDVGPVGVRQSVGQYALLSEGDLVGTLVVVCVNLGDREMGPYVSNALVLGTPHSDSPEGQAQAVPLRADPGSKPGEAVY